MVTQREKNIAILQKRARQVPALVPPPQPTALESQVGGDHYKALPIQPVEYIHANKLGYFEGNVVKYVTRWKTKDGIADLEKAKHYIELLMQMELEIQPED